MGEEKPAVRETRARRVKGDILLGVLEHVAEGIGDFSALFMAFVETGYGASYGKISRELARSRAAEAAVRRTMAIEKEAKRRYRQLRYVLRRDGLIEEKEGVKRTWLRLTRKGRAKLASLRKQKGEALPPAAYISTKAEAFTIVTFDVPERERRKREWLRAALRSLEFTLVQKSVWIGKIKLPEKFVRDLRRLNLVEFVEIFQITRAGSLQHVI